MNLIGTGELWSLTLDCFFFFPSSKSLRRSDLFIFWVILKYWTSVCLVAKSSIQLMLLLSSKVLQIRRVLEPMAQLQAVGGVVCYRGMSWVQKSDQEWKREPGFPRATYGYRSTWHPPEKVQSHLPLGTPSSEFRPELFPGVTLLPIYTSPTFAPTGTPVPGHFLGYHLVPPSLCLPDHRSHGLAFLRHPASSPVGSAPHTSRLQPASFLPRSKFPPSYSNQLTLQLPHRGWGNHSRPRSLVPRSFAVVAPYNPVGL